jgi:ribonuclease HI
LDLFIGTGVYHPQSNKIATVNPGGTSTNKIINRAELAGIAAVLTNKHTHIATDSAGALWQIRNSILYPQRVKRHKHAKFLETIVHHIQLFKDTIHLYKVRAHAGILGNECADAIAKFSAENQSGHDIHINTDAHPHSSIFWPARVENPSPACLPDTLNTCQPGPSAERLSILSDLDAEKAHARSI